jgi:hypothetical protein
MVGLKSLHQNLVARMQPLGEPNLKELRRLQLTVYRVSFNIGGGVESYEEL